MKPHILLEIEYTDDGCMLFKCGTCNAFHEGRFGMENLKYCHSCGVKFNHKLRYEEAVKNRWKRAVIRKRVANPIEMGNRLYRDPLAEREPGYLVGCKVEKSTYCEPVYDEATRDYIGNKEWTIIRAVTKEGSSHFGMACVRTVKFESAEEILTANGEDYE